jgi:hypothetical protein
MAGSKRVNPSWRQAMKKGLAGKGKAFSGILKSRVEAWTTINRV